MTTAPGLVAAALLLGAGLVLGWMWYRRRRVHNRRQEEELFAVIGRLPWALMMLEDDRISYANPTVVRLLEGNAAHELVGRPFLDLIVREDQAAVAEWLAAAGRKQMPPALNVCVKRIDGQLRHVRIAGAWVVYGARSMFEVQLYDRQTEHQAQAEAEYLASFLRLTPEPVVEVQPGGHILFLNEAARAAMPDLEARGLTHPFFSCLDLWREELRSGVPFVYGMCEVDGRTYDHTVYTGPDGTSLRIYARDVTYREESRRALRESENRFDMLFRISPVGFSISRVRDGRFLEVNSSFARLLGYTSPDEIVGRTTVEVGLWESEAMRARLIELVQRVKRVEPRLTTIRTRTGDVRRVLGSAELIEIDGEPCIVGMMLDVEERERLQAEVEVERDFARSVIDTVGQGLLISDAQFRVQYVNPALLRMTGFTEAEALEMDPAAFLHPDDRERIVADRPGRMAGEGSERYQVRVLRKDGTYLDALVAVVPRHTGGGYVGTTTVVVDVSEQQAAARKIEQLQQFYEEVLHGLPLDVVAMDAQGRYLFLNQHAVRDAETRAKLVGGRPEDYARLRGRDPAVYLERQAWIDRVIESKQPSEYEETLETPRGPRHMLRVARPILDAAGDLAYIVSYSVDITARKRSEAELIRARDEAEMLSALKSNFIANMSHEVRTPLTAVIGFAEVLHDEIESPQLRELATLIHESGARLLETLNSVLDLARMEAGAVELDLKPTNLVPLTRTTISLFRSIAEAKGIALESHLPAGEVSARVDGPAYNRIVSNLLSNAIKFTNAGRVRIEMQRAEGVVVIRVQDTGIGMDPGFIGQAFEAFRQESSGLARSHTGSGLGLSIVNGLVQMMHGHIEIESQKGAGTTVRVTFPVVLPDAAGE